MAKNIAYYLLILFVLGTGYRANCSDCVEAVYTSQIGVREATGHNDGKEVEQYLKAVKLGKGYAWCAAFVKWCYDQCGIKTTINAWAASTVNQNNVVWKGGKWYKTPRPGDVCTIYSYTMKRISHTLFFHRLEDNIVVSVEGNTNEGGSREGDGVYKRRRPLFSINGIYRWADGG